MQVRSVVLAALLALVFVPACDTAADSALEGDCRGDADCAQDSTCRAPGEAAACGVSCVYGQLRACEADGDCGADSICQEYYGPCCTGHDLSSFPHEGRSSRCVAACDATSCGAGQRCEGDGMCRAIPCTEQGGACAEHFECAPSGACRRGGCGSDADCDGGACVEGQCYEQAGVCEPMAA